MTDERQIGLVRFIRLAGRLKRTVRTGWIDRGIPPEQVESVADHSFRVALLAWAASAGDSSLDRDRILLLALIHDLAEALTGDLTPYDIDQMKEKDAATFLNQRHIPGEERTSAKRIAEAKAVEDMSSELPEPLKSEITELWRELEERQTPEARFVKQVDKLETYLQSLEYAAEHPDLPIESFATEVSEVVDIPSLVSLRDAMRDLQKR